MNITSILKKNRKNFGKIIDIDTSGSFVLDLSNKNGGLSSVNISNTSEFDSYIKGVIRKNRAHFAVGRYNEDRTIYQSDLFSGKSRRTIHLGIDLWVPSGTKILAPLAGLVHSFANNKAEGDYGPTIILEHELQGVKFYTLYGHLSLDSLNSLYEGKQIKLGEMMGKVGNFPINGNWPSHLHFQIITDMRGMRGDFPGVASSEKIEEFLEICPNPNLILQIPGLG